MLKISAIRDVMGHIGSLQTEFGHPITPGNTVEHKVNSAFWRKRVPWGVKQNGEDMAMICGVY